jgi:adenylate cyclase
MAVLIAQGRRFEDRWRRSIPPDQACRLGRAAPQFRVPWDDRISREHVQLQAVDQLLRVEKLSTAANPVFYRGEPQEKFYLQPGEHFVIGSTSFTLLIDAAQVSLALPSPTRQNSFSQEFLQRIQFRDAEQRIEVLNRLPDVISSSSNEEDLLNKIANTLLAGMSAAARVAFVRCPASPLVPDSPALPDSFSPDSIVIIHWDQRQSLSSDFQPSGTLIRQAVGSGQTILHQWQASDSESSEFTIDRHSDWAFVCPIHSAATPDWAIYVAGRQRGDRLATPGKEIPEDLQGDIKFCQLVGSILVQLMQVRQLERRQASLRSFFSPIVMETLVGRDSEEALTPQKCDISVMFCDLRGFSQQSEAMGAELFQLLNRVSRSLDVMTGEILKQGGVIGDFHGDAAMGFWGWPLRLANSAQPAIEAALAIEAGFREMKAEPLDFKIAIGIATGECVAGRIGSQDQVKVTAFGPVVNLASRLEGLNRWLNSSILIDRDTLLNALQGADPAKQDWSGLNWRWRRLGCFQPYGMQSIVEVYQILPADTVQQDQQLVVFEQGLQAFQQGDWEKCQRILQELPPSDPGRMFLQDYMLRHSPPDWTGAIRLTTK